MTEAISILAMERKALRHQHAKKDYLIARLRVKIASLERLIPVPHHAPRAKSNVTCYACGVTGHYSNKCPVKAANKAPRTGSNAVPITQTSRSTVTCYECGTVGHFSNECRKKLAKIAANPSALAQQQHHIATRRKFAPNYPNNRNGRYYNLKATETQETSQNMPSGPQSPGQHAPTTHWCDRSGMAMPSHVCRHAHRGQPSTRRPAPSLAPSLLPEHQRRTANPPDTLATTALDRRRQRRRHNPVDTAADTDARRHHQTVPHLAFTLVSFA
ncbi:hypothetical protein QYE76_008633 [Lolium multiflorum]|uniref:CCHC-type domain-containing protein n=1 Tax=Lolium multiflorum TaxID=4521 RepID=A0AAD8X0H0_LOLMU|nr:hypothetical protein QYE76_008633 [Lolium multiflorum]